MLRRLPFFFSGLLVALALSGGAWFAAPAFADPSEDKTMGSSFSNPDGGGVDKPYAADGQAAGTQGSTPEPDGNNGCGQEKKAGVSPDEFGLDDNNGNCGNKHTSGGAD
jgi:hypothetical protein